MTEIVLLAGALDVVLLYLALRGLARSGGIALRLRIFWALLGAMLIAALATGLYATAYDDASLGFFPRLVQVAPKGFVVASGLFPLALLLAAWAGAWLARPLEELSEAATRIAQGDAYRSPRTGSGAEAQQLARALHAMRQEIADKPYAAAFLRDAWHDLKSPVAAISATLEVLEDGAIDEADQATVRRFLENMRRSSDQLERRLQDLVTLSRYETSALAKAEDVGFDHVVRRALESVRPLAEARGVTMSVPERAPKLRCDTGALSRALANLLDNAVSASPGGRVSIEVEEKEKGRLVFFVKNEPAVVPDEMRPFLFQRGARGGSGKGSGLGLAIARAAIEAHGGKVAFVQMGPPRVVVRVELPR